MTLLYYCLLVPQATYWWYIPQDLAVRVPALSERKYPFRTRSYFYLAGHALDLRAIWFVELRSSCPCDLLLS